MRRSLLGISFVLQGGHTVCIEWRGGRMAAVETTPVVEPWIVEDRSRGIFRVNRRAFVDPAILERERRYIFDTCWLYLGHESEVAAKGDFLTRTVGGRELIFVRGKDDRVR